MKLIILFALTQQLLAAQFPFTEYTLVSRAFDGTVCLTGCSPENDCVINWKWEKRNCRTFEVAPIYLTSRQVDPLRKYCLTNCGYFGYNYEWCITTEDLKWDYCSSNQGTTFQPTGHPVTYTRLGQTCSDNCRRTEEEKYYWCRFYNANNELKWEYCAPPALPRIPVLRDTFSIGAKKKGNCNGFLKYIPGALETTTATDAADYYVTDIADAIEASELHNALTETHKVTEANSPIEKYTMVHIRNTSVPAVIRAHITTNTLRAEDKSKIPEEVERKLREQMTGCPSSYEAGRLIGSQLGGPSKYYNVVPRSVNWKCEEWWDMEHLVEDWCRKTGGSVDMAVVVFYRDSNTPIPNAFGVTLVFRNTDNSIFVECREKIHNNYF